MLHCPSCAAECPDGAVFCPACAARTDGTPVTSGMSVLQRTVLSVAVLGFALAVFFGQFRLVSGAPRVVVARQYFGFDEPFASVADCTSSPWIIASAQHGKLCSDLQAAGILESDESRNARAQREVQKAMDDARIEMQRQTNAIMRSLR